MKCLRKLAHWFKQLVLCQDDSANTVADNNSCDELVESDTPTEMTIKDRIYDILGFLREDEMFVVGQTMIERAIEMDAHRGEDDAQYLLDNQEDIPVSLRGKVMFVFTDLLRNDRFGMVTYVLYVVWDEDSRQWGLGGHWHGGDWNDEFRVLRRRK